MPCTDNYRNPAISWCMLYLILHGLKKSWNKMVWLVSDHFSVKPALVRVSKCWNPVYWFVSMVSICIGPYWCLGADWSYHTNCVLVVFLFFFKSANFGKYYRYQYCTVLMEKHCGVQYGYLKPWCIADIELKKRRYRGKEERERK